MDSSTDLPSNKQTNRANQKAGAGDRRQDIRNNRKRLENKSGPQNNQRDKTSLTPDRTSVVPPAQRRPRHYFAVLSFLIVFLIPTVVVGCYYAFIASDQYRSDAQFSVRGVTQSPLADLGILALPGSANQGGDSYIVTDYIVSSQLIYDLNDLQGVDLRRFYSSEDIDVVYRIDPDMPIEEFREYWKNRIKVGYNSTTGNTELRVFAFKADDARLIAEQILILSERLVNEISSKSREQLLDANRKEVQRTEDRLNDIRKKLLGFRDREQAFDPEQVADLQVGIVRELEAQLSALETRKRSIGGSIGDDSPAVRVLNAQIAALEEQIAIQNAKFGSGDGALSGSTAIANDESDRNLSQILDEYSELQLQQTFATTAYTGALAALEEADAQARQQQRYFATYVFPRAPEISLYPKRLVNTCIAAFWFLCFWAIFYFVGRSVRDHAI